MAIRPRAEVVTAAGAVVVAVGAAVLAGRRGVRPPGRYLDASEVAPRRRDRAVHLRAEELEALILRARVALDQAVTGDQGRVTDSVDWLLAELEHLRQR